MTYLPADSDVEVVASWLAAHSTVRRLKKILADGEGRKTNDVLKLLGTSTRRRQSIAELAEAVVRRFGEELLSDATRRRQIWNGLKQPLKNATADLVLCGRWHRGGATPRRLVAQLGLPTFMAGSRRPSAPDDEEVPAFNPLSTLHDYQTSVGRKLRNVLRAPPPKANRCVLWLPTGTGKTRVTVETLMLDLPFTMERNLVLWVADRSELCEQAVQDFRHLWMMQAYKRTKQHGAAPPPLRLHRAWGGHPVPETLSDDPTVIVASIQKLHRMLDDEELEESLALLGERAQVVVLDEAHKARSRTYREVLRGLGLAHRKNYFDRNRRTGPALVGLTATPVRGNDRETRALRRLFGDRLVEPGRSHRTYSAFEKDGFLAASTLLVRPTSHILEANEEDLRHWATFGDFSRRVVNRAGQNPKRTAEIVLQLEEHTANLKSVLVFACSVSHASTLAQVLLTRGHNAAALDGTSSRAVRHATIDAFRLGRLKFLVNCDLLATGFDAPNVDCVALARPVGSRVLYAQMVGRGLRGPKNGGTEHCLILDFEDSSSDYETLDDLRQSFRAHWRATR